MTPGAGHRLDILAEDDDDPMLSAVNLVDVFLVLVVALLTAVVAQKQSTAPEATPVRNPGQPDMELVVPEQGREVRLRGSGAASVAEGSERAGVAYRLKDGSIVYVPEAGAAAAAIASPAPAAANTATNAPSR